MTLPSTARGTRPPAAPTAAAVSLRGARLSFGERTLWSGLDLDVAPGEFVAVLGPNGSGKTSLVRVLLGLEPLSAGEVRIAGREPAAGQPAHRLHPAAEGARPGSAAARARPRRARPGRAPAGHRLPRAAGAPGPRRCGVGRGGRHELRGRAGRAPLRRRAAAAAGGPGAGRRPGRAAVRRAAALARPGPPGRRHRADRPAAAGGGHRGRVRHPRDQPDPAAGGPGAVPGGRPVPDRRRRTR